MTETLTADVIRAMPAGPELDALVAERVLGWRKVPVPHDLRPSEWQWETPEGYSHHPAAVGRYSMDISAAWEVVEKLTDKYEVGFDVFWSGGTSVELYPKTGPALNVKANSAPLAICRAALLATLES